MKTARFGLLLGCAALLFGASGCVSQSKSALHHTFAITVTVQGKAPTASQRAAAIAQYKDAMEARGWVLIENPTSADEIWHLNFVPDPADPEHKGQATVLGITRHVATHPRVYASAGYVSNYSDGYYVPAPYYYNYGPYSRGNYDYGDSGYTYVRPEPRTPPSSGNDQTSRGSTTYHKPVPHSTDNPRMHVLPDSGSSSSIYSPSYSSSSSSNDYSSGSSSSSSYSSSSSGSSSSYSSSSDSGSSYSSSSSSSSDSGSSGGGGSVHYESGSSRSVDK